MSSEIIAFVLGAMLGGTVGFIACCILVGDKVLNSIKP